MKVLVFSDSHGKIENMLAIIDEQMPDAVIHLGDHTEDAQAISECFDVCVYSVSGNSFGDMVSDVPVSRVIELMGHRLYLCHGHEHNVKSSYLSLSYAASEHGAELALFGHTHIPCDEEYNGVRLINPGSVSKGWRGNTYAELEVNKEKLICVIHDA